MTISELRLINDHTLQIDGVDYPCTIGRGGIAASGQKREGDLKTPSGIFPLRQCFYRPDRLSVPTTLLPVTALKPNDGWCDDPASPQYNLPVQVPFASGHEKLWRDDNVYDLIIPLGYNDETIVPGMGSAIFMHVMRDDGVGTEGCIALEKETLLKLLPGFSTYTVVKI